MRYAIKNSLLILTALFMTLNLFAQRGQGTPEERAERMTENMTRSLNLNEEQSQQVKSIHLKYATKMKTIRSNDGSKENRRIAMQEMRSELDKELKTVLNLEQYEKLKSMPKKRTKGRNGYRGGVKHNAQSKAFKEKVKPILLDQRVKLESKISAADKAVLVQIRRAIKAKNAERMELRKQDKDKRVRPGDGSKKKLRDDPNRQKLKALAEKYQIEIEPLLEEIEPQLKALKEEIKSSQKGRDAKSRKSFEQHKDKEVRKEKKHLKRYARFLLLDPTGPVKE